VGIPPYYPLEYPYTPDNPVYKPKKFLGKKCLVLKWESILKKEFLEKIWKNWVLGYKFYK
jgi:hypothetical protein